CGACTETCPVHIDLHHHLLHNRRNAAAAHPAPLEKLALRAYGWLAGRPALFSLAGKLGKLALRAFSPLLGTALDPARGWTRCRALPEPPRQSFREWWKTHEPEPASERDDDDEE
ncbi:MAG: DUF3390 domain-containing protein, partial [Verrucomicrobiae bacterium]|nr:DUF3390 domain-containing protein [Verrucomicrobiae bacterium]